MSTRPDLEPWPRRPARLATAVIEELVDRIVGGDFPDGSTLPTEPVLCETFGVSRSVLREATKALETMRLVKVQQGQGTTVLPLLHWDLLNQVVLAAVVRHDQELAILDDLVDVRRALESQMAQATAHRMTDDTRTLMDEQLAALEASVDEPEDYVAADVAFHDVILKASGNLLGRAIISTLTDQAYRSLRYIGEPSTEDRVNSNVVHRAIRDADVAAAGERAAELMNQHILDAWERRRPEATKSRRGPSKT
jgi:GntR family galactonate operon transcriptional repressor